MAITKDIYFAIEELRCKYLEFGIDNPAIPAKEVSQDLFEILKEYKKTIPLLIYSQGDQPRPTVVCASCHHVVVLRSHDCPGTPGRKEGESAEDYSARARIFFEKLRSSVAYPPDDPSKRRDAWSSL